MTDMLDRCVRAVGAVPTIRDCTVGSHLSTKTIEAIVRAVIAEMREPTYQMCVTGWKKAEERDAILGNGEIAMIYQAMIDEALS